jgi:hypothetical protein
MRSRFPQRVALERHALRLINGSGLFPEPLVGLCAPTINRWLRVIGTANGGLEALQTALLCVAYAARADSDISDEVFADIEEDGVQDAMSGLETALAKFSIRARF